MSRTKNEKDAASFTSRRTAPAMAPQPPLIGGNRRRIGPLSGRGPGLNGRATSYKTKRSGVFKPNGIHRDTRGPKVPWHYAVAGGNRQVHPSNDLEGIFQSAWGVKSHVLAVVKPGGARARQTWQGVSTAADCSSRSWQRFPGSTGGWITFPGAGTLPSSPLGIVEGLDENPGLCRVRIDPC